MEPFAQYEELRRKVGEKFDSIAQDKSIHLQCGKGCHSCCLPELSVSRLEFDYIEKFLSKNPGTAVKVRNAIEHYQKESAPKQCALLDGKGFCMIYQVRPLICMSHGAPITFKNKNDESSWDICPLNESALNEDNIKQSLYFNIDTLNLILAALNQAYDSEASPDRFALIALVPSP